LNEAVKRCHEEEETGNLRHEAERVGLDEGVEDVEERRSQTGGCSKALASEEVDERGREDAQGRVEEL
jgi:hypothetical protein